MWLTKSVLIIALSHSVKYQAKKSNNRIKKTKKLQILDNTFSK